MNAFSQAWIFLKALPEQQMFTEAPRRENAGEPRMDMDRGNFQPEIDASGATSHGTVHPAILGMLQRYQDEKINDLPPGSYPPNLNLDSGEIDQRIIEDRDFQTRVMGRPPKTEDEQSEHYLSGGSIAEHPNYMGRAQQHDPDMSTGFYGPFAGIGHDNRRGTGYGVQPRYWASHPTPDEEAIGKAWTTLKALPEQQMFQEGNTRRNVAEGQRYSDDPIIDSSGATSEGTVHPAIYGMLQRYEESQRPGRSTEPLPNLNLRGPRVGGSIASGPDRYGLPDDSVAAEDGPFMGTLGKWPHGREMNPQGDQRRHWRTHPE